MLVFKWEGWGVPLKGFLALMIFGVLAGIGSGGMPLLHSGSQTTVLPSLGDGVGAGMFAAGAVCATVVGWRRQAHVRVGWLAALGGVVACQSLAVTLLALTAPAC